MSYKGHYFKAQLERAKAPFLPVKAPIYSSKFSPVAMLGFNKVAYMLIHLQLCREPLLIKEVEEYYVNGTAIRKNCGRAF